VGLFRSVGVGEFLCDRRVSGQLALHGRWRLKWCVSTKHRWWVTLILSVTTQGHHNPQRRSCWTPKSYKAARKLELAVCRHGRILPSTCSSEVGRIQVRGKGKKARN